MPICFNLTLLIKKIKIMFYFLDKIKILLYDIYIMKINRNSQQQSNVMFLL